MASRLHRKGAELWPRAVPELDERPIDRFDRGIWGLGTAIEVGRVWAIEEPAPLRRNGCSVGVYGRELPRRLARPASSAAEPDPSSRIRQRVERRAIFRGAPAGMQDREDASTVCVSEPMPSGSDEPAGDRSVAVHSDPRASARPSRFRSCRVISGHSLRRGRDAALLLGDSEAESATVTRDDDACAPGIGRRGRERQGG